MRHWREGLAVLWLLSLLSVGCKGVSRMDPEAGMPVATTFWQALQSTDATKAVNLYAPTTWGQDPQARTNWSALLVGLGQQYGVVASVNRTSTKVFPGEELVPDHRPFVCCAYEYEVRREKLASRERLIICGEPEGRTADWRIYGHDLTRLDTRQSLQLGISFSEMTVPVVP